jgi:hypothetical protein
LANTISGLFTVFWLYLFTEATLNAVPDLLEARIHRVDLL